MLLYKDENPESSYIFQFNFKQSNSIKRYTHKYGKQVI